MEQLRESLTREELIKEINAVDDEQLKIDEYLKNYFEIKSQIDKLTEALKVENKKIVDMLTSEYNTKKYIGNEYSATVAYKDSIKCGDEQALITLLKQDDSLKSYVVEAINTKGLNELIKNSESVATKLNGKYTKTPQSSLTVKKL